MGGDRQLRGRRRRGHLVGRQRGPRRTSLRSPADRATTAFNCFAIGAVDATNYGWPYPIASFSSRGPHAAATWSPALKIKPEVSAPGVDVYSSVPGGGYSAS